MDKKTERPPFLADLQELKLHVSQVISEANQDWSDYGQRKRIPVPEAMALHTRLRELEEIWDRLCQLETKWEKA